jgi:hypothetical protein
MRSGERRLYGNNRVWIGTETGKNGLGAAISSNAALAFQLSLSFPRRMQLVNRLCKQSIRVYFWPSPKGESPEYSSPETGELRLEAAGNRFPR